MHSEGACFCALHACRSGRSLQLNRQGDSVSLVFKHASTVCHRIHNGPQFRPFKAPLML